MTGEEIAAALREAGRGALVLVTEAKGSAPAEAGAAMLVTERATFGTVGGGSVEHRAAQAAREMLARSPLAPAVLRDLRRASGATVPCEPRKEKGGAGRTDDAQAGADAQAAPQRRERPSVRPVASISLSTGGPLLSSSLSSAARTAPPVSGARTSPLASPLSPLGGEGRGEGGASAKCSDPAASLRLDFPLGPALDQCCGGRLRLALAPLSAADAPRFETGDAVSLGEGVVWTPAPPPRAVLIYGAGHVGRALVAALAPLPFRLRWIDARAGFTAGAPPGVETVETPLPEAEAAAAPPDALHLVLTHSHALDLEIVAAALAREAAMVGLIGSATKRATFLRRLDERGLGAAARARLVCPIGLPGLKDRRPTVIAASVAADLLQRDAALRAARRGAA